MRNRFKTGLAEGRVQLGMWSSLCSPVAAEIIAQSQFDWMLFDAEHSPVDMAGLFPLLQAAGNGSVPVLVRPPWNDAVLIKRALDMGVGTLLLPFVQNEEEARAAVAAARYPPRGRRGVAGSTRASRYGRDKDYHRDADDGICVLVQVETAEALARIDSIAAVDGIDGVFIGPADLSASMGHLGNPMADEVQRSIRDAAGAIRAAGKAPGIMAATVADTRRYIDWGYLFIAAGFDLRLLTQAIDRLHLELAEG